MITRLFYYSYKFYEFYIHLHKIIKCKKENHAWIYITYNLKWLFDLMGWGVMLKCFLSFSILDLKFNMPFCKKEKKKRKQQRTGLLTKTYYSDNIWPNIQEPCSNPRTQSAIQLRLFYPKQYITNTYRKRHEISAIFHNSLQYSILL